MRTDRLFGLALALFAGAGISTAQAVSCTETGFFRDATNLTAALINPGAVARQEIDATGCHIGIYYGPGETGSVLQSRIHGSNYFGVVISGAMVDLSRNVIYQIGENPFAALLRGEAIYCDRDSSQPAGGKIDRNLIFNYQRNGITFAGPNCTKVEIVDNKIVGRGPISEMAQNGIVVGWGAGGTEGARIERNTVLLHSYTGPAAAASSGIIMVGGPCYGGEMQRLAQVRGNTLEGNDVGIFAVNLRADCDTAPLGNPMLNVIEGNKIANHLIVNTSGNAPGPYQVGISHAGRRDFIRNNEICGNGYRSKTASADAFIVPIDPLGSANVIQGNFCGKQSVDPTPAPVQHAPKKRALTKAQKAWLLPSK